MEKEKENVLIYEDSKRLSIKLKENLYEEFETLHKDQKTLLKKIEGLKGKLVKDQKKLQNRDLRLELIKDAEKFHQLTNKYFDNALKMMVLEQRIKKLRGEFKLENVKPSKKFKSIGYEYGEAQLAFMKRDGMFTDEVLQAFVNINLHAPHPFELNLKGDLSLKEKTPLVACLSKEVLTKRLKIFSSEFETVLDTTKRQERILVKMKENLMSVKLQFDRDPWKTELWIKDDIKEEKKHGKDPNRISTTELVPRDVNPYVNGLAVYSGNLTYLQQLSNKVVKLENILKPQNKDKQKKSILNKLKIGNNHGEPVFKKLKVEQDHGEKKLGQIDGKFYTKDITSFILSLEDRGLKIEPKVRATMMEKLHNINTLRNATQKQQEKSDVTHQAGATINQMGKQAKSDNSFANHSRYAQDQSVKSSKEVSKSSNKSTDNRERS